LYKERIGYPTQKPEALIERIIRCASNESDLVLDAFVGGGTTVAVADKLKRRWVGIDQSVQAVRVSDLRLEAQRDLFSSDYGVRLHTYDYDVLRNMDAFEFVTWIVQQLGGVANVKQRSEKGIDGRMPDGTPIQVKRSEDIGRTVVDNFLSAAERHNPELFEHNKQQGTPVGIIIAFSFGRGLVEEAARLKNQKGVTFRLVRVDDIVRVSKKPTVKLQYMVIGTDAKGLRTIEFKAEAKSPAGIEFFSWSWNQPEGEMFRADVLYDKDGHQVHHFQAGNHRIAVKVVDMAGLVGLEAVNLKINGGVSTG
jgi:DNA methylase